MGCCILARRAVGPASPAHKSKDPFVHLGPSPRPLRPAGGGQGEEGEEEECEREEGKGGTAEGPVGNARSRSGEKKDTTT